MCDLLDTCLMLVQDWGCCLREWLPLSVILTEIKIKLVSVSVKTQFEDLLCFSPSLLYCVYILLIPFIIMQFGLVFHQSIFSNSNFKKILFFQMVNTH